MEWAVISAGYRGECAVSACGGVGAHGREGAGSGEPKEHAG